MKQLILPQQPAQGTYYRPKQLLGSRGAASSWVYGFLICQMICQFGLLFGPAGVTRVLVRSTAFGSSLALLALIAPCGPRHPAWRWAFLSLLIVGLGVFHPTTNTLLAGLAQLGLYVAIAAPLFWTTRLPINFSVFLRVLMILWGFHTLSAIFGVLQVYYPGRFLPNISTVLAKSEYVDGLTITLASGDRVFRPMGLTDVPGGAASAGFLAILFGVGFFLTERSWVLRFAAAGSMVIGLFCIYLSQVRSILVLVAVSLIIFVLALWRRGELGRSLGVALLVPAIVLLSFSWAVAVGGEGVTNRLSTLVEYRPGTVYYKNRGHFLEHTIAELMPTYPLGAGLGRWGMMNLYFGDNSDLERAPIWVEIQLTAWLLDGGVPLIICYTIAVLVACWAAWRLATSTAHRELGSWAALILGYNVGAVALTFNYPLFIGQGGMEFWLLNGCLFGAGVQVRRDAGAKRAQAVANGLPLPPEAQAELVGDRA